MTTIHAQRLGDQALVPRGDLDRLVELACRSEAVELRWRGEDDLPASGLMALAERGGAFDYWSEPGEDVYTSHDGEPV